MRLKRVERVGKKAGKRPNILARLVCLALCLTLAHADTDLQAIQADQLPLSFVEFLPRDDG